MLTLRRDAKHTPIEENLVRVRAHRSNIRRYRWLLSTKLSDLERTFIEKRLEEEEAASNALLQAAFPLRAPPAGLPARKAA